MSRGGASGDLAALPDGLAVDGELVAFGSDGLPSFPRLCDRMLHGKHRIEVMLVIFDLPAVEGRDVTTCLPACSSPSPLDTSPPASPWSQFWCR